MRTLTLTVEREAITPVNRSEKILQPGKNVWKIGRVLVDAAEYFRAARETMLNAKRSILIMGWDAHSRTRLVVGDGPCRSPKKLV